MTGTGKFVFQNYTGEPEEDQKNSLPTPRQRVMHDFFRRQRVTDDAKDFTEHRTKHTKDAPQPELKRARRRRGRARLRDGSPPIDYPSSLPPYVGLPPSPGDMENNIEAPLSPCSNPPGSPRPPNQIGFELLNEDSIRLLADVGPDSIAHLGTTEVSNIPSASTPQVPMSDVTSPFHDSAIAMLEYYRERDLRKDQRHKRSTSPSVRDQSESLSDTGSKTSSGRPLDDFDDLDKHFLDMETCRLRSWLLTRLGSEPFLQHLQNQVAYQQRNSSTPQDQPADSSSKSTSGSSSSSPSTSSSIPTTLSGGISSGSKRRRDGSGEEDERQKKKRRVPQKEANLTSTPRLACFYNKYDPMMYRQNAQTRKKFEICATHDFQNTNKLFEHLKRVHSGQPMQCPRCTRTDFRTAEELLIHQTASEACIYIPLTQIKRIKWIGDEQRLALQSDIAKELRGCSDEEKWKFAYRGLFPDISPDNVPSPFFEDPVISTVSFVVDHYEEHLRNEIRQSTDLPDLESRIPTILGRFLAQYRIDAEVWNHDHSHDVQARVAPSTSSRSRLATEVDPAASQPTSNPSYDLGDAGWLQGDDFVLPTYDVFGDWAPQYDGFNENGIGDHVLNLTDLEADAFGVTSS